MKKMDEKKASAAPKAAVKKPAVKKAAPKATPKAAAKKPVDLSPEERYRMVEEAAYFIAERHGFNGDTIYFWTLAEAEIRDQMK
ncbi:MAG: DUF2934 domain-containing protein [Verrucomicrobiota bacterium]|nr:DUF2934 domain-containing protein [Verrucomicrobiota bacterium]